MGDDGTSSSQDLSKKPSSPSRLSMEQSALGIKLLFIVCLWFFFAIFWSVFNLARRRRYRAPQEA